jgi:hypothetical protein
LLCLMPTLALAYSVILCPSHRRSSLQPPSGLNGNHNRLTARLLPTEVILRSGSRVSSNSFGYTRLIRLEMISSFILN